MKLAADLDGMAIGSASQLSECEPRTGFFMEHLAKVPVTWEDGKDAIRLGVADDIWVKVRIDGKEGWIHSDEDLHPVGLYRAG